MGKLEERFAAIRAKISEYREKEEWTSDDRAAVDALLSEGQSVASEIERRSALSALDSRADDLAALREATEMASRIGASVPSDEQTKVLSGMGGTRDLNVNLASAKDFHDARKAGVSREEIIRAFEEGKRHRIIGGEVMLRTMAVGSDQAGGYLVPTILATELYTELNSYPGARAAGARVIQTESGAELKMSIAVTPAEATTEADVFTAESATITETPRTFRQITLGAHKITDRIDETRELMADEVVDVDSYIGTELGRAIAQKTEWAFHSGDGSGAPQGYGLINSFRVGNNDIDGIVRTASDDGATIEEVLRLVGLQDEDYDIPGAVRWLMRRGSFETIITQKDSDGRYLVPDVYQMQPQRTLRGYPVVMAKYGSDVVGLPADTSTSGVNTHVLTFAHWNRFYVIREVNTMSVTVNPYIREDRDEIVYFARIRIDGRILDRRAGNALFTSGTANS